MGAILALFRGGASGHQITIDFENVSPTEAELKIWNDVDTMLRRKDDILTAITQYRGQDELIRKSISERSDSTDLTKIGPFEQEAWDVISAQADTIHDFYKFATMLGDEFRKLLIELFQTDAKTTLTDKQALCKQLGLILDFVLAFDNKKVTNPGIQNDFSYYRRAMPRMKQVLKGELNIIDEVANRISMFIANPSPMMAHLVEIVRSMGDEAKGNASLSEILVLFANVCNDMVEKAIFENNDTNMFCLRVMTGCIILNDHISTLGSYHKKTEIKIKDCIMQLKNFTENDEYIDAIHSLLDTIRYTSLHVNDADTPGYIKALLI